VELVRYTAMCAAIAECHAVDEALDIHDKARALEVYAKQARNTEAEGKARDVRIRAERRTGELLADLARANGGDHRSVKAVGHDGALLEPSPYALALNANAIPRRTADRYQQLAAVPAEVFEAAMTADAPPSTRAIIDAVRDPVPQVTIAALWVWGRLRDFEQGYLDSSAQQLVDGMTPTMQADVRRVAPRLRTLLGAMLEALS